MLAVHVGFQHARADAARCAFAAHDQAVDTAFVEMGDQRRAEEGAGAFLAEHGVFRVWRKGIMDFAILGDHLDIRAPGRRNAVRIELCRDVENRHASRPASGDQLLRRRDCATGTDTEAIGKVLFQFVGIFAPALVDQFVQVDHKQGWVIAYARFAGIGRIGFEILGLHDIGPAMVFELCFRCHIFLVLLCFACRVQPVGRL